MAYFNAFGNIDGRGGGMYGGEGEFFRGDRRIPTVPETAKKGLNVSENTFPVGLFKHHHVLDFEQGADVRVFPEKCTKKVLKSDYWKSR